MNIQDYSIEDARHNNVINGIDESISDYLRSINTDLVLIKMEIEDFLNKQYPLTYSEEVKLNSLRLKEKLCA